MKHIRTKLILTYIGLTVFVLVAVSILSSIELDSYFRSWITDDLETRADVILESLKNLQVGNQKEFSDHLRTISHSGGVRVTLIAADGSVIEDSEILDENLLQVENHLMRPEIQQAARFARGTDIRQSATVGIEYLYLAKRLQRPLFIGVSKSAEYLRLSIPLIELQKVSDEIHLKILIAGIFVLILVIGVSILVSYRISKPMIEIARKAETIHTGNLDTTIEITSKDEIGQVAKAFNEMVERLKMDITQLKKLEQVRSQFLGNVSHELRTPIFALQGYLETLLDGAIDDPNVNRDFLEKAHSHAIRLNALLNDLIDISRIESGEMKMSFRYFNLKEFVDSVCADFQSMAEVKKITLALNPAIDPVLQVLGDRERLTQLLTNLIDNAIKYNQTGGQVTIIARELDNIIWIDVVDTGVGIADEHLSRIFERFYRVDKERSREAGGTGLGLAIVKHIIEAHGGKVEVRSELGKGSTFSVSLKK
jgi:two-component system phosphate regulon sensor histidine kinase PhoR